MHYFETSKGIVYGTVRDNIFYPYDYRIIESLFVIADYDGFEVRDGFVRIELSDSYCGIPEYKLLGG